MPITPFMGVRISWLMLAMNCDLASFAASARFCDSRNTSSAFLRSVMSRATCTEPIIVAILIAQRRNSQLEVASQLLFIELGAVLLSVF